MNEVVKKSFELRQKIKECEALIEAKKAEIAQLEADLAPIDQQLLEYIKKENVQELQFEKLFLNHVAKTTIGYTSDADVIAYLKENGYNKYVKTKVTESLDKTNLKKELKTNEVLKGNLDNFIVEKLTEYVVVTNEENHAKMIEHIESAKK